MADGDTAADRRGSVVDRRAGVDRRGSDLGADPVTGLERRRSAGRRRSDFRRSAEDGHMTREQFLFVQAIDAFKRANGATFPAWTDVLEVIRLLGYRKTMASELNLPSAEDWSERADAGSGVRPDGWERRFTRGELASLEMGEASGEDAAADDEAGPGAMTEADLDVLLGGGPETLDEAA